MVLHAIGLDAIVPARAPTLSSIAVVMATCQGERFVAAQLASLANQTRRPDRLLVSDDGSTDATPALVEAFAAIAPFPVTLHRNQARLGSTGNFIAATRRTDAEIILFADQDDIWLPGKIAAVAAALETGPDLLVGHDIALIDADGQTLVPSYFRRLAADRLPASLCIKGCSLAFRRDLVARWGWPAPQPGASHDLWIASLAMAAGRRGVLDRVLVEHRLHGANASGWFVRRQRLHPARRALRDLTPFRAWAERDVFLECYYPLANPLGPDAVAAAVARHPAMADARALARFARSASFHRGFARFFPGARHRTV
jgi:glycosyltransferase involved in cell wall biosynthesis